VPATQRHEGLRGLSWKILHVISTFFRVVYKLVIASINHCGCGMSVLPIVLTGTVFYTGNIFSILKLHVSTSPQLVIFRSRLLGNVVRTMNGGVFIWF